MSKETLIVLMTANTDSSKKYYQ